MDTQSTAQAAVLRCNAFATSMAVLNAPHLDLTNDTLLQALVPKTIEQQRHGRWLGALLAPRTAPILEISPLLLNCSKTHQYARALSRGITARIARVILLVRKHGTGDTITKITRPLE